MTEKRIVDGKPPQVGEEDSDLVIPPEVDIIPTPGEPTASHLWTIEEHVKNLHSFAKMKTQASAIVPGFNFNHVQGYLPWIYLDEDLNLRMEKIKREDYISVVKEVSPNVALVLENTDLDKLLPDEFNFLDSANLEKIHPFVRIKEEPSRRSLISLLRLDSPTFMIKGYQQFSILMENGEQFREYLSVAKPREPSVLLGMYRTKDSDNREGWATDKNFLRSDQIFSQDRILKYVEAKGQVNILEMVREYNVAVEFINSAGDNVPKIKNLLLQKLKKYCANLFVAEKND